MKKKWLFLYAHLLRRRANIFKDCFSSIKSKGSQMGFQKLQTLQKTKGPALCPTIVQTGVQELPAPFSTLQIGL